MGVAGQDPRGGGRAGDCQHQLDCYCLRAALPGTCRLHLSAGAYGEFAEGPGLPGACGPARGHFAAGPRAYCKPATPEFDEAQSTGRAARFIIRTKDGSPIMVFCLYLAADADRDGGKAAISQAVMEAVELEWAATGVQDILMVGDFNAEAGTVPALAALLEKQAVLDVWERLGPEGDGGATCFAKGLVGTGKRRDWILASPAVFARVKAVRVREGAGYDTHKPVQVLLGPAGAAPPRSVLVSPRPFAERVAQQFGDDCGPIHDCITARLAGVVVQLGACRDRRDTNGMWRTWSRAVEAGVIDALRLPAAEAKAYRGRGAPHTSCAACPGLLVQAAGRPQWGRGHCHRSPRGPPEAPPHGAPCRIRAEAQGGAWQPGGDRHCERVGQGDCRPRRLCCREGLGRPGRWRRRGLVCCRV